MGQCSCSTYKSTSLTHSCHVYQNKVWGWWNCRSLFSLLSCRVILRCWMNYPTFFFLTYWACRSKYCAFLELPIQLWLLYSMCYFILWKGVIMCIILRLSIICYLHFKVFIFEWETQTVYSNKHFWSCFCFILWSLPHISKKNNKFVMYILPYTDGL